jgi:DNA-binding transcriptional ArsR family regulator
MADTTTQEPPDLAPLLDSARRASELLKALSHESRLLILCLLVDGEKSVSDLEQRLGLPQAGVSQHLARLRADGLVAARREGRMIFYRIATPEVTKVIATLHDIYCA